MANDMLDRLDAVRASFSRALVLGGAPVGLSGRLSDRGIACVDADPGFLAHCPNPAVQCDEDRLPFADRSFDLVLALGTLDTVSDLPGALLLINRTLADDGLFMGTMMGAGSLPFLRSGLSLAADGARAVSRFHPQIDVRGAGDLLARAHFSLPVAESETISARYRSLDRLIGDLRANGLANCLSRRVPLSRSDYARLASRFSEPVVEQFAILTVTGWARPSRPAAPGAE